MNIIIIWIVVACLVAGAWAIIRAFCKAIEDFERIERGDE